MSLSLPASAQTALYPAGSDDGRFRLKSYQNLFYDFCCLCHAPCGYPLRVLPHPPQIHPDLCGTAPDRDGPLALYPDRSGYPAFLPVPFPGSGRRDGPGRISARFFHQLRDGPVWWNPYADFCRPADPMYAERGGHPSLSQVWHRYQDGPHICGRPVLTPDHPESSLLRRQYQILSVRRRRVWPILIPDEPCPVPDGRNRQAPLFWARLSPSLRQGSGILPRPDPFWELNLPCSLHRNGQPAKPDQLSQTERQMLLLSPVPVNGAAPGGPPRSLYVQLTSASRRQRTNGFRPCEPVPPQPVWSQMHLSLPKPWQHLRTGLPPQQAPHPHHRLYGIPLPVLRHCRDGFPLPALRCLQDGLLPLTRFFSL